MRQQSRKLLVDQPDPGCGSVHGYLIQLSIMQPQFACAFYLLSASSTRYPEQHIADCLIAVAVAVND